MVTIGVDAHKRIHAAVAVDAAGVVLGAWRGSNALADWQALHAWAHTYPGPQQWGIEGAWNYGRGLAQYLVAQGEVVYEINPRWTAHRRRGARTPGKSDRLDAHAVTKLVREEAATLPRITPEDESALLDLLVTERDAVVADATRLRNQLHQLLLQTTPTYAEQLPSLTSKVGLRALETYTVTSAQPLQQQRAAAIRRLAQRLRLAHDQAVTLEQEIGALVRAHYLPLTQVTGVDLLTAGALAGILGPGRRFRSERHVAAYAGVAPLEASSAGITRHRLNPGGNRRLNAIVHRIALSQARHAPQARAYLARRQQEGKTWREAMRALKRHLIRAIWRQWQHCLALQEGGREAWAA